MTVSRVEREFVACVGRRGRQPGEFARQPRSRPPAQTGKAYQALSASSEVPGKRLLNKYGRRVQRTTCMSLEASCDRVLRREAITLDASATRCVTSKKRCSATRS